MQCSLSLSASCSFCRNTNNTLLHQDPEPLCHVFSLCLTCLCFPADTFTQQLLVTDKHIPPEHLDQLDPPVNAEQDGEQLPDLDEAEIIQFTYNSRCTVRSGEHVDQLSPAGTEPESAGADQDVQLVSSETEDSDDYSKASTDTSSAPNRPKQKRRGRGVFSCRVCNRSFTASRFLFRHVKAHLQEAEPVCGLCGDRFEAAESLKLHIQTHQTTRENQSRTRSREGQFHQNLQPDAYARVHRSKKPHTCDDCGETFLQVWKKKKHRCRLRESQGSVEKTTARMKT